MTKKGFSWKGFVLATFTSILFILQIIVGIYLLSDVSKNEILAYSGVGLHVFSGLVFGWLPIIEFRKKGRVKKGKKLYSYQSTCRHWKLFYCSPSTVCYFHIVGNCWSAPFPALDCYPAWCSHYTLNVY